MSNLGSYQPIPKPEASEAKRPYARSAILLGAAACSAALLLAANPAKVEAAKAAKPPAGCLRYGYNYSGEEGNTVVKAVVATVTETAPPQIEGEHVAGWIGVEDDGNTNEWLQAGIEQSAGQSQSYVYIEEKLPGHVPKFTSLQPINIGSPVKLALKENWPSQPDQWSLFINGHRYSSDFNLPNSQTQLVPEITAESLERIVNTCNSFQFRFSEISISRETNNKRELSFTKLGKLAYRMRDVTKNGFIASDIDLP